MVCMWEKHLVHRGGAINVSVREDQPLKFLRRDNRNIKEEKM